MPSVLPIKRAALVLGILVLLTPSAPFAEEVRVRGDQAERCAPGNKLCQHIRRAFEKSLSRDRKHEIGLPIWRHTVRYATEGLNEAGDHIFDALIEGFAGKAGLTVERVDRTEAARADIAIIITHDIAGMIESPRFRSIARGEIGAARRAELIKQQQDNGMLLLATAENQSWNRAEIRDCFGSLHPKQMETAPGLRMASMIYRCLSGTNSSDEVRPSILNSATPEVLNDAPYARMAAVDGAMLRVLYARELGPGSALFDVTSIEAKLRAEGFGDDGIRR